MKKALIFLDYAPFNARIILAIHMKYGILVSTADLKAVVFDDERVYSGVYRIISRSDELGLIIYWSFEKMYGNMLYEWLMLGE